MQNHDIWRVVALVCYWICAACNHTVVFGQSPVFETFDDGSFSDGEPLGWRAASPPWGMGTHLVTNGDLVLTPSNIATPLTGTPNWTETDLLVENYPVANASIRTQLRAIPATGPVGYLAGIIARDTHEDLPLTGQGVLGYVTSAGRVTLGLSDGITPIDLASSQVVGNHLARDLHLQLDVVDSNAQLTFWLDGDVRPVEPQIRGTIPPNFPIVGNVLLFNGRVLNGNPATPVAFRHFAAYASTGVLGDFNYDSEVTSEDIDLLFANLDNENDLMYDVDGDVDVDQDDVTRLLSGVLDTTYGDANLDGRVDELDFETWQAHLFQKETNWKSGDFNGDGTTDVRDFHLWHANRGHGASARAIPEPAFPCVLLSVIALGGLMFPSRRHKRCSGASVLRARPYSPRRTV